MYHVKWLNFGGLGLVFFLVCVSLPNVSSKTDINTSSQSLVFELYKFLHSENISSTTIVQQLNSDVQKTLAYSNDRFNNVYSLEKCLDSLILLTAGIVEGEMWAYSSKLHRL